MRTMQATLDVANGTFRGEFDVLNQYRDGTGSLCVDLGRDGRRLVCGLVIERVERVSVPINRICVAADGSGLSDAAQCGAARAAGVASEPAGPSAGRAVAARVTSAERTQRRRNAVAVPNVASVTGGESAGMQLAPRSEPDAAIDLPPTVEQPGHSASTATKTRRLF